MKKLLTAETFVDKIINWKIKSRYAETDEFPLMESPYPIMAIVIAYLVFILKLGPDFMKNRKPFELRKTLVVYNALQVVASVAIVVKTISLFSQVGLFQYTCLAEQKGVRSQFLSTCYFYFMCKISELLDTVFFVLRKKSNQVSFLHVYHHTLMAAGAWAFMKYDVDFWMIFLGFLNGSVHVVMYAYYGLSAFPNLQKYLWWKKYITSLQLLQFVLLIVHVTVSLFLAEKKCKPTFNTVIFCYSHLALFIYLFASFYYNTYKKNNIANSKHKLNAENAKGDLNIKKAKRLFSDKNGVPHENGVKNGSTRKRI